jgi:hypothetical protein
MYVEPVSGEWCIWVASDGEDARPRYYSAPLNIPKCEMIIAVRHGLRIPQAERILAEKYGTWYKVVTGVDVCLHCLTAGGDFKLRDGYVTTTYGGTRQYTRVYANGDLKVFVAECDRPDRYLKDCVEKIIRGLASCDHGAI